MKNNMVVELDEKVYLKVKEVARDLGMSEDDVVNQIIKWYFEECEEE